MSNEIQNLINSTRVPQMDATKTATTLTKLILAGEEHAPTSIAGEIPSLIAAKARLDGTLKTPPSSDIAVASQAVNKAGRGLYQQLVAVRDHSEEGSQRFEDANNVLTEVFPARTAFLKMAAEEKAYLLEPYCAKFADRAVAASLRRLNLTADAQSLADKVTALRDVCGLVEHQPVVTPDRQGAIAEARAAIREWVHIVAGTVRRADAPTADTAALLLQPLFSVKGRRTKKAPVALVVTPPGPLAVVPAAPATPPAPLAVVPAAPVAPPAP